VILSGRRREALDPLATEIGGRVVVADLARRDDVLRCLDEVGEIDVLVANAALPSTGTLSEFDEERIDRSLDVNLRAPIVMAHRFGAGMAERKRGHIVFISSIAGKVASPRSSMYAATKFGMRGFALGLREDLRASGVGVTTVFPGFIRDAGMFAESNVKLPTGTGTRTPDDVALAVVRAVRKNPDEITVAALEQVLGAFAAGFSHSLVMRIQRMLGADAISKRLASGQTHKR
jgi:short-subunit dehydrogenase